MTPRTLTTLAASFWWLPGLRGSLLACADQWHREQRAAADNMLELEEARGMLADTQRRCTRLQSALDEIVESARLDERDAMDRLRLVETAPNVVRLPKRPALRAVEGVAS